MNFEPRTIDRDGQESRPVTATPDWMVDADQAPVARRRRLLIIAGIVAAVLIAAFLIYRATRPAPATDGAAAAAGTAPANSGGAPTITVVTPGRSTVERVISSTGTLGARREMPVGVAGEGGQVLRVLVEPGQWVAAGQVLATVDRAVQTQQIEQLAASIRVSQADARLAQAELDRSQALVGRGFVSKADIDRKTATRDSAVGRVRVAQAQLAEARARTGRLDIRAPAAGLVLTRGVEPGQVVSPGSGVLFRIARDGEMELLAAVSETDLTALATGASATVTPVGSTSGYTGQIWQLSPIIDPQSRQGTARIALAYAPGLRPGGFAEARIVAGAAQAPLLPESAVLSDDKGHYVYIVDGANKAARRDVEIGTVNNLGIPIVAGLTGQEKVVLTAGAFLNPGDRVIPVMQRR